MKCPGHFQRLRPNPFTRFISIGLCSFLLYSSLFSSLSRLRRTLCEQKCEAAPVFPSTLPDCAQCGSGWGQNTSSLNQENVSVCWAAWLVPSNSSCICYLFMFFHWSDPWAHFDSARNSSERGACTRCATGSVRQSSKDCNLRVRWHIGPPCHVCACVRVCVCACVRACVCVCGCVTSK